MTDECRSRNDSFADRLRAKLKERSKGEVETWGFVAMFMEMIDEVEEESARSESGERKCDNCGESMVQSWHCYECHGPNSV